MAKRVFYVDVPIDNGVNWYRIIRDDRIEVIAETVRILLSANTSRPVEIRIGSEQFAD